MSNTNTEQEVYDLQYTIAQLVTLLSSIDSKANQSELDNLGNNTYRKSEIDSKLASVYVYKGTKTVAEINALTGQDVGWTYNVSDTGTITGGISVKSGDNVAWTADGWDKLAGEIDLSPFTSYSTVPVQIGTWIDGTPIWRVAFQMTASDLLNKNPALWDDRLVVFGDLVSLSNPNSVKIITNYAVYASQAAPCIVDSWALYYDGNIGFNFDENITRNVHDVFYGFIEFATSSENI